MSVTGYMYNINATKKLQDVELKEGYEGNRSWHHQFKDSAYVYVGGLHTGLTEGDAVIVFSQFGEIVDVNMVRDKSTGKSKGFAFICYEDQRSTILAVDNMNGFQLLGRTLRVDHVAKYKAPKKLDEVELDEDGDPKLLEYEATGAEGKGQGMYNVVESQKKIADIDAEKKNKAVAANADKEDEDEAWAKAFDASIGAEKATKAERKALKKEKDELKKMKKETKKLKKMAKKVKKDAKKSGKKTQKEVGGEKKKKKAKKRVSSDSSSGSASSATDGSES